MPRSVAEHTSPSHREEFSRACGETPDSARDRKLLAPLDRFTLARFFSRIELMENGCWLWRAALNSDWADGTSYGCFNGTSAHRVAYLWFVGPIPPGYQIDHLCRVRGCVNPAHLEAVTQGTNRLRASLFELVGLCRRGHEMTPSNMGMMKNGAKGTVRICIRCRRLRDMRRTRKTL